jgi:hypothetical protein
MVIEPKNGHSRATRNWVLGRFWRDFNDVVDKEMEHEAEHISPLDAGDGQQQGPPAEVKNGEAAKPGGKPSPAFEGLRISIFEVEDGDSTKHGVPTLDWIWFLGVAVIVVQLGIAAIPWGVNGQWDVFLVTAAGNLFSLIGGSLRQWTREKWACPKEGGQTIALTEGNGTRRVVVIVGKRAERIGLDLEIMAVGTRTAPASLFTRIANSALAVLWILLLITVAGMKQNTWCESQSQLLRFLSPPLWVTGPLHSFPSI